MQNVPPQMAAPLAPELSLIVLTHDTYDVCRRVIGFAARQTARDRIELVLAGPSAARIAADPADMAAFGHHQIVEVGEVVSTGEAIAEAVRAARAPVTCYLEEHDYIADDYAERIIGAMRRFDGPAVGFAMRPHNPGLVSWAHAFLQFGEVVDPVTADEVGELGGHHVAYRRDFLLGYGTFLPEVMTHEGILFEDLRKAGTPLHVAGDIVVEHVQISRLGALMRLEHMSQRIYADGRARSQGWSPARRALYVAGSPAIPFLRVWRSVRQVVRAGRARQLLPQVVPVMFAAACAGAAGEAIGYVLGSRREAHRARTAVELDRYAFVRAADRAAAGAHR